MLIRFVCLAMLAGSCLAQSRPISNTLIEEPGPRRVSRLWVASSIALLAATSADMASSWGRYEANPMLRSADGRFGVRGASIKLAMAGAIIVPQMFFMRRSPRWQRLFTIANFAQAGLYTGVAIRNYGVQDRSAPRQPGQP
jgi:hypothetical protein